VSGGAAGAAAGAACVAAAESQTNISKLPVPFGRKLNPVIDLGIGMAEWGVVPAPQPMRYGRG
jgi:hypothetical protein